MASAEENEVITFYSVAELVSCCHHWPSWLTVNLCGLYRLHWTIWLWCWVYRTSAVYTSLTHTNISILFPCVTSWISILNSLSCDGGHILSPAMYGMNDYMNIDSNSVRHISCTALCIYTQHTEHYTLYTQHTHTYTHTYTHAYIHTHMHTHTKAGMKPEDLHSNVH